MFISCLPDVIPVNQVNTVASVTVIEYNESNDSYVIRCENNRDVVVDAQIVAMFITREYLDSPHDIIGKTFTTTVCG